MSASAQIANVMETVRDAVLNGVEGAELSPQIIDIDSDPSPKMDTQFSIEVSDVSDTELYADQDVYRLDMPFVVSFMQAVKMLDQFESFKSVMQRDEAYVRAIGDATAYGPTRVYFKGVRHALTPTREHHLVNVDFVVTFDFNQTTHLEVR